MRMRATSTDGVAIAFDRVGVGRAAIVLVHGWSCDRSYWRHQQSLADRFEIVTLDLAGHGDSGHARAEWSMQAYGDDVAAVVSALGAHEVVLVGHSMGGNACLEAARRRKGPVRGLVWIDAYGTLDVPASAPSIDEIAAPFRADFVGATHAFVSSMFLPDEDPAVARRVVNGMSSAPEHIALESVVASLTYGRTAHRLVTDADIPIVAETVDRLLG